MWVNHNASFKKITLSFVYFSQEIFFWAIILHIINSIIGNVSQMLCNSSQQQFCQNSWAVNLFWAFICQVNFQHRFHILLVYQVTLSYKLGDSCQETRTTRMNKIKNQEPIYSLGNITIWWTVFAKIVSVFELPTIVAKRSIIDVRLGSK